MITGHGDDIYQYGTDIRINFSSNVYGKADITPLKRHLIQHIDAIKHYPQPEPFTLEKEIEQAFSLPQGSVCVTNGATETIYLIAQAYRKSRTSIIIPTFSEYADACGRNSHTITYIKSIQDIPQDTETVWLCNPNNPTGEVTPREKLLEVINSHPNTLFVIDQSYEFFTFENMLSPAEAATYSNVILIHSFTKQYSIPGLRLGYFTAKNVLTAKIRANRMPWSVNALAIEAGLFLMRQGLPSIDLSSYLSECHRFYLNILSTRIGIIYPTQTHFLLCRLYHNTAAELKDYLVTHFGILIRDASNFEGLDNHYFRITTQSRKENDELIKAFKAWLCRE